MGENGPPPLSRRVPGTTSMPKAHGRRPPPKLPDGVLERLQAEVLAARAKQAVELEASDPGQSEEASLPEPSRGWAPEAIQADGLLQAVQGGTAAR